MGPETSVQSLRTHRRRYRKARSLPSKDSCRNQQVARGSLLRAATPVPGTLTAQVADCIWQHLEPKAVAVVIEATHSCMTARGVNTPGVMMTTSRMMGTFRSDERSRREVLALMGY